MRIRVQKSITLTGVPIALDPSTDEGTVQITTSATTGTLRHARMAAMAAFAAADPGSRGPSDITLEQVDIDDFVRQGDDGIMVTLRFTFVARDLP